MAKITAIPATIDRYSAALISGLKKRRVAAYARVSTDHEEQLTSYEAQVDYYTNYINGRDDWEFVSVYADATVIIGLNQQSQPGRKFCVNAVGSSQRKKSKWKLCPRQGAARLNWLVHLCSGAGGRYACVNAVPRPRKR